jgi:hypothetical protein
LTRPGPKLGTVAIAVSLVAIPATAAEIVHYPQVDGPDIITIAGVNPLEALLPQFFIPYDPTGTKTWPKAPAPDYPGRYAGIGREIQRQQRKEEEARYAFPGVLGKAMPINPQNWDNFLANTPRSTNIEDRRFSDPTMQGDVSIPSYQEGGRAVYQIGGRATADAQASPAWRRTSSKVRRAATYSSGLRRNP